MELETFTGVIALLKNAIGLAKDANELAENSPKRKAAEIALIQAEQQLRLAETKAAMELGYNLCQCTFPPQIALLQKDGSHRCPKCERDTDDDMRAFGAIGGSGGSY